MKLQLVSDNTMYCYFMFQRQDLVHLGIGLVRPTLDNLLIRVDLGKDDMDQFVLCVAQKKIAAKLGKDMADLVRNLFIFHYVIYI